MNIDENPFKFLEHYDVTTVAQILSSELPFIAGAALSRTSPVFNAKVMANMQEKIRNEIASAITKYRKIPTEVMYDIAEELEKKLSDPTTSNLQQQKSSMLANLDLGSLMQDINKLKSKKPPPPDASGKPEPVASRIIKPEEYDAFLRGELPESPAAANAGKKAGGLNPEDFIPTDHKKNGFTLNSSTPKTHKPQITEELNHDTRKELALEQALLHARTKKQENRRPLHPKAGRAQGKEAYKAQKIDGMALAAHILRESPPEVRKMVMREIPDLYHKLNDRMFDFADLEQSSRDTIGLIFSGLSPKTSALALRFSSDELKNTALTSVSKRKARLIIDEFKRTAKERVCITDIEDAQQEVIDYAVMLQNRGEIIIDPDDSGLV